MSKKKTQPQEEKAKKPIPPSGLAESVSLQSSDGKALFKLEESGAATPPKMIKVNDPDDVPAKKQKNVDAIVSVLQKAAEKEKARGITNKEKMLQQGIQLDFVNVIQNIEHGYDTGVFPQDFESTYIPADMVGTGGIELAEKDDEINDPEMLFLADDGNTIRAPIGGGKIPPPHTGEITRVITWEAGPEEDKKMVVAVGYYAKHNDRFLRAVHYVERKGVIWRITDFINGGAHHEIPIVNGEPDWKSGIFNGDSSKGYAFQGDHYPGSSSRLPAKTPTVTKKDLAYGYGDSIYSSEMGKNFKYDPALVDDEEFDEIFVDSKIDELEADELETARKSDWDIYLNTIVHSHLHSKTKKSKVKKTKAGKQTELYPTKGTSYASCHEGIVHVFDMTFKQKDGSTRKVKITAGGTSRKGGWLDSNPLPDLVLGPVDVVKPIRLPMGWKIKTTLPEFIAVQWPDYSIPILPASFWPSLISDLKEHPEIKHMHVMCQGGHGRTGTALSILWGLLSPKVKTTDEVVKQVRGMYCDHAVESESQMRYIEACIGKPWEKKVTGYKTSTTNSYGYGSGYGAGSTVSSTTKKTLLGGSEYNEFKRLCTELRLTAETVRETGEVILLYKGVKMTQKYDERAALGWLRSLNQKTREIANNLEKSDLSATNK